MTGAYADVSALEQQIITEALRRVAILQPLVAMVMAEVVAAEDAELAVLVAKIDVAAPEFASRVLAGIISEVLARQVLPARGFAGGCA